MFFIEISLKCIHVDPDANNSASMSMMTSSNGTFSALYQPFVRGIHRSPVNSPNKGQ